MRFAIATALLGVAGLTVAAAAQTPPAAPTIARTVVAGIKLPSIGNAPLYFKAVSVSIPAGQTISLSAPNGILYQLSGSTEASAGEAKTITSGGGVLIGGGTTAALTAGNGDDRTRPRRHLLSNTTGLAFSRCLRRLEPAEKHHEPIAERELE
ncbi:MAG: hypothetical protein WBX30_31615, partial [Stellaceae bacterium]